MSPIVEILSSPWIYWTTMAIYTILILSVIVIIIGENRNPVKSLAWVTVLLVAPLIGLVLYLIFGRNIQRKHILSRRNRRVLRRLGEPNSAKYDQSWNFTTESQQLVKMLQSLNSSAFYTGNDVEIFTDGKSKFDAFKRDLLAAERSIHLQYYIFSDDNLGREIKQILIDKARQGVAVRVIYDHVGSFPTRNRFFKEMRKAGVEIYPFFRVAFPNLGSHINWRNHRKVTVIDGKIGYIGGMNIADRYIDGVKWGRWRDTHIRVVGPAVAAMLRSFAVDWAFMGNGLVQEVCDAEPQAANMGMQMVTSGPTSNWEVTTLVYLKAISMARKRIFIQTPYFLPTQSLLEALQAAALSGVDVRVMMPRRSDSHMLRYASFSYIAECLRSGMKIYLYDAGMLHAKTMIIDDELSVVGSTNFDFRSFEHNFEGNMMIHSREFNKRMRDIFAEDLADSTRVTAQEWRRRSLVHRALSSFMRLFSPIL